MDLFELIKVVFRRWYVVLPIGLVALGLAYSVQTSTPPAYEATGYLQLQTPELDRAEDPGAGAIDPVALSAGIVVDGDAKASVTPLEGQYFSITSAAQTSEAASAAVNQVMSGLEAQVLAVQEDLEIPEAEQIDLRMVGPEVAVEVQEDGSFLANADMFLYDPTTSSPNPYRPDASTGRLLQVAATGDAGRQRFAELADPGVAFEVGQDTRDAAALLQVLTVGSDPDAVVDAFYDVQTIMAEDLDARQARADVAEAERITVEVLDAPLTAVDVSPPVDRAVVAILGLGGVLALAAGFGLESLARRRADTPPTGGDREGREPSPGEAPTAEVWAIDPSSDPERPMGAIEPARPSIPPAPVRVGDSIVPTSREQSGDGESSEPRPSRGAAGDTVRSTPVDFVGAGEILTGYMANPATGVGPGVLVIHDWCGLDDRVKATTERLAAEGFVALAPDLYGGVVPNSFQEAEALMHERSVEAVTGQLSAALDYLERQWFVLGSKSGVVGTSMGGGLAIALAAAEPDRVAASVCYYPVGSYGEVDLTKVAAPILIHAGSDDPLVGPDRLLRIEATLERSESPSVQIRTYPGAGHFFLNEDNEYGGTYSEELVESTWKASVGFLASRLWMEHSPVATKSPPS